jgi:hypothetical protein
MDMRIGFVYIASFLLLLTSCYKSDLDAANAENEILKSQINALNTQINGLNNQIVNLNNQVSNLNSEILRLQGVIEELEVEIVDLQDVIEDLEVEISDLKDLTVFYQTQLLELQTSLLGISESNEDLIAANEDILSSITINVEVLKFLSEKISSITTQLNASYESDDARNLEITSMIKDLDTFIDRYNEIKSEDLDLKVGLIKHINASLLLEGVNFYDFGATADPTVATTNCEWVDLLEDNNENVVMSFHSKTSTLLITHGDASKNIAILNSENDNLKFHSNFFGAPKKILIVAAVRSNSFTLLIDELQGQGHIVDYLYLTKEQFDETDYPELSSSNLSRYQAIYYDDGIGRPSTGILNSLKDFVNNPNKRSIIISLGWVWSSYRSTYDGEPLPINSVLEPIGAKFNTWINDTSSVKTGGVVQYPSTYSESENCDL